MTKMDIEKSVIIKGGSCNSDASNCKLAIHFRKLGNFTLCFRGLHIVLSDVSFRIVLKKKTND